ncbi:MAG: hypothetical protein HY868_14940 [Chloroflexi bacterium]|nr:hypothetical protein [Chloroflexota bacterium]
MSIQSKPRTYRSFLLRLWAEGEPPVWRFSLEDPHTGERIGMANLDALIAFLKEAMEQVNQNETINHSSA